MEAPAATFSMLPEEVAEKVLRRLDHVSDVARFSLVSKYWYHFIHSKEFWRRRSTIGCMYVYNESQCSSYSVFDDFQSVLSCTSERHVRSTCGYLNTGLLPGRDFKHCICAEQDWKEETWPGDHLCIRAEQDWKEETWPGDHLIRYLDTSYGIICAYDIMSDKLYLFDPCRSPSLCSLGSPPLSDTDCNVRNLSFRVTLLDDSYVIILLTTTLHLLVYQSHIGTWSRSTSGYPGSVYDLNESNQPHPIIGNSIYFLGKDGKIWTYSIDVDSWSYKKFLLPEDQFGDLKIDALIQMRGKLMLVGINEKQHLLSMWLCNELCNEEGELYLFMPLASLDIYDDITLRKATAADDLVCVQSCIVDRTGKTQILVFVYCHSTNMWQYLDGKPCDEEVSVDYFVVEARVLGLGAMRNHFQIIGDGEL